MKKNTVISLLVGAGIVALIAIVIAIQDKPVPMPMDRAAETDWTRGNPSAEVTLIEYADFQCPACAAYHSMVNSVAETYGPNIAVVFRHFPLSQIHRNAFLAAQAAEAAGKQGKFFEMHDKLFEEQTAWGEARNARDLFRQYAEQIGLNGDQFATDIDDKAISDKIKMEQKSGYAINVQGTPTFVLNGTIIESPGSLTEFKAVIDAALQNVPRRDLTDADFSSAADAHTSADILIMVNGKAVPLTASSTSGYVKTADSGTVIHRHKEGLTLGYALASLGVTLTEKCITVNGTESCTNDTNSLKFFVNGSRSLAFDRYVFSPGDKMLISYGPLTDGTIDAQLKQVPDNAKKHMEEDAHKNETAHDEHTP